MSFKDTYRLGVYEKAAPAELSWEERLAAAKEAGFDYIEMSIDETDMRMSRLDWCDEQIYELLETEKRVGIPIETICFSAQRKYPLGSRKWERRQRSFCEKVFSLPGKWVSGSSRLRAMTVTTRRRAIRRRGRDSTEIWKRERCLPPPTV